MRFERIPAVKGASAHVATTAKENEGTRELGTDSSTT
ncbi:hypothetical protein PC129_g14995 [Phytophthora cactorum]|uniref:Uncharacterized protein n=1 Tax=Phytophthora cactorum TaxID=29920 RepID=A0A329RLE1_9STRA|nr:hypothetical protein Pcac1_g8170 [Phytophthora cactorum]KAG2819017.1 hypothetical protein PC111_g12055 [Phytophthora cactorum]KAG2836355.1 hypothetical protein PC112_g5343 [Phytophthora cactorum]KAG2854153.1 hypothetical protein PC113_g13563 [Phytophthora cactorum]KAG2886302.1 hypothetical protein PC114_g19321 [Phytophthora cactorum]